MTHRNRHELTEYTLSVVLDYLNKCRLRGGVYVLPRSVEMSELFAPFISMNQGKYDLIVAHETFVSDFRDYVREASEAVKSGLRLCFKVTLSGQVVPTYVSRNERLDYGVYVSLTDAKIASSNGSCSKCPVLLTAVSRFSRVFEQDFSRVRERLLLDPSTHVDVLTAIERLHDAHEMLKSDVRKNQS